VEYVSADICGQILISTEILLAKYHWRVALQEVWEGLEARATDIPRTIEDKRIPYLRGTDQDYGTTGDGTKLGGQTTKESLWGKTTKEAL